MNNIRYKIWYDLWMNKSRTLQVVLIISMGAFAMGMILGTRNLVIAGIQEIWQTTSPAAIALSANPPISDEALTTLGRIDGVANVEGFSTHLIEWRRDPGEPWQPAGLTARADYDHQQYSKLSLVSGRWPHDRTLAFEQGGDTAFNLQEGEEVQLRINGREQTVTLGGTIYNPVGMPPSFGGNAHFYISRDRLGELTGNRGFNRVLAGVDVYDEATAAETATQMQDKLEKLGVYSAGATVFLSRTADPHKHFFQDILDGIFLVLGIMATLALILGLFLVYNTINAIISQQIDQIGIMKAIGATRGQILLTYLLMIMTYGFLALLIALPLGIAGAWGLHVVLLNFFNVEVGAFQVSPTAVLAQIAIALLAPLLAALIPIFTGANITVREAINTYGLTAGVGLIEQFLAKFEQLSRLVLLTISNAFRHKGRVLLTQISLVLSGVIFMMVMGVRDSAQYTYSEVLGSILRFDANFSLAELTREEAIQAAVSSHEGITTAEQWHTNSGTIHLAHLPATDDDEIALLFGAPLPTGLYAPQLRSGRWLTPADEDAIVLNQTLAEELGAAVGDWVMFDHGLDTETQWQVVGLLFDPVVSFSAYVPQKTLAQALGTAGKVNALWLETDASAVDLRRHFADYRLELAPDSVLGADTAQEITTQALNRVSIIISLLGTMAMVIGLVGGIALSGVLSLNVQERRREIGVMRAVGASSAAVTQLFIGEGLILGWLSWLIAWPLSVPAARLMTEILGATVRTTMMYRYTFTGVLLWFAIITILAVLASWVPARHATRISVQASLAYQ